MEIATDRKIRRLNGKQQKTFFLTKPVTKAAVVPTSGGKWREKHSFPL